MANSVYLAKLIGPVMLIAAIGMLVNAAGFRAMAQQFLQSSPLIFLTGVLAMTAGIAIVLYHNVWAADWRVIITLFGWAGAIGGAARILLPDRVKTVGEAMLTRQSWVPTAGGAIWLVIGLVLCFFGYFR